MEPVNTEIKRNTDGTFANGTTGGPGRPKGQSLKEFWRERFKNMTDEEKQEFSKNVSNEMLFKMAEGNPENKTDLTNDGKPFEFIITKYGDDKPVI